MSETQRCDRCKQSQLHHRDCPETVLQHGSEDAYHKAVAFFENGRTLGRDNPFLTLSRGSSTNPYFAFGFDRGAAERIGEETTPSPEEVLASIKTPIDEI